LLLNVRSYVPPVTSALVQQLMLPEPQLLRPSPPGEQFGAARTQLPAEQISVPPQEVPLATLVHTVVLAAGWQLWHAFPGFNTLAAYTVEEMKQPDSHAPPLHTAPVPQPIPSVTLVHAVVLVVGWHDWHASAAFSVLAVYRVAPMKQPGAHVPALQTSPVAQPAPTAT